MTIIWKPFEEECGACTKEEVLEFFCGLVSWISAERFGNQIAADCFGGCNYEPEGTPFRFNREILRYVGKAVEEALIRDDALEEEEPK